MAKLLYQLMASFAVMSIGHLMVTRTDPSPGWRRKKSRTEARVTIFGRRDHYAMIYAVLWLYQWNGCLRLIY